MISAKDYDDFDSAWHDACGPTQVPEIPDCDYSSITETILFRRRSNDYNLPDEFDYFEQKPKYFILNPDDYR
jgi:hypothetical protein